MPSKKMTARDYIFIFSFLFYNLSIAKENAFFWENKT